MTAVELTDLKRFAATSDETVPAGIEDRQISALFESDNSLRMYFEYGEGEDPYSYEYTIDGQPATLMRKGESEYYVEISNVPANHLDTIHTITVSKGGVTCTMTACVLSYARTSIQYGTVARQNLGKALYLYNGKANNYFGDNS